jgi:hypothetical protein
MNILIKRTKLEYCKDELKPLLRKLIDGSYYLTAQHIFDHIANSGVEMDLNPELRGAITMEEFLEIEKSKPTL